MFGFLKDKLKGAINIFKKKVEDEVPEEETELEIDDKPVEKTPTKAVTKNIEEKGYDDNEDKDDTSEAREKKEVKTKDEKSAKIKIDLKKSDVKKSNDSKSKSLDKSRNAKAKEEFEEEELHSKNISKGTKTDKAELISIKKDDLISEEIIEKTTSPDIKKTQTTSETEKNQNYVDESPVDSGDKGKKRGFFGKLFGSFMGKKEDSESELDQIEDEKDVETEVSKPTEKITPELDSEIKKLEEEALEEEKLAKELEQEDKELPKDIKKEMDDVLAETEVDSGEAEILVKKDAKDSVEKLKEDVLEEELIEDELKEELITEKVYEKSKEDQEASKLDATDEDVEQIEGVIGGELDTHQKELKKEKEDLKKQKKDEFEKKYAESTEKKGFFQRFTETFTTKKISDEKFEEMFWELEVAMLENNVAIEVIEKIKNDLKSNIVGKPLPKNSIEQIILESLKDSIDSLFDRDSIDVIELIKTKKNQGKPFVICFVGINGSGKTTTIAKFAHLLKSHDLSSVIAAADTFRAAAIDQLEEHAQRLGVKLVRHDYNADPAAVAFDAIKHAESKTKDVVLIDTAGRLHSNQNLMEELHKIVKVAKPDLTIFVGESITGNDCIEQAREFDKMVKIDGIILSKADIDQKGGAAISISYVLKKPILYFGVGQNYEDLRPFSIDFINENLNLGAEEN